jgi:predicted ATP-dependent protease
LKDTIAIIGEHLQQDGDPTGSIPLQGGFHQLTAQPFARSPFDSSVNVIYRHIVVPSSLNSQTESGISGRVTAPLPHRYHYLSSQFGEELPSSGISYSLLPLDLRPLGMSRHLSPSLAIFLSDFIISAAQGKARQSRCKGSQSLLIFRKGFQGVNMDLEKYKVAADKLRWHCPPEQFTFDCTQELTPLQAFIGQDRAIRAIEFGLAMERPGYNIYVAGLTGTGKTTVVKNYIQLSIKAKEAERGVYHPDDWCYIYNLSAPDRPQIVKLPQGKGKVFKAQMNHLLQGLKEELSKAFSGEEYAAARKKLQEETQTAQRQLLQQLDAEAQQRGFLLQFSPVGAALIPVIQGKPLSQEEYLALEEKVRKGIEAERADFMSKVEATVQKAHDIEKQAVEKLRELDRRIGEFTIDKLFQELFLQYQDSPTITQYLTELKSYTLDNLDLFKQPEAPASPPPGAPFPQALWGRDPFLPFEVNVFVDNSETTGPPVIVEANPTYGNLFGKTERRFLFGGYLSDHTMLKAGALNLANGGYLLLNARDVLSKPGVWEGLKRVIRSKEVHIEDPFEQFGLIAPQGLRPQPMPVEVKVILLGDSLLYALLSATDEEFWELFKVKADFNFEIDRSEENMQAYACFICRCCEEEGLRHFDRSGVAKLVEYGARAVADQEKLSSRFAQIKELIVEADYWAGKSGASLVSAEHVQRAVEEKIYRHNLIDERIREMIQRGFLMIDVKGTAVGQVNGLSIYTLGDITFGKPSRITAKTFLGREGVINVERESQLSGRIHDKGVLIITGYLGWKYAQDKPLSLSASLCFEQSYEGVEGDSASSAELYAILSSLSQVPLKQSIAVTGSVNQKGEVQPIGGVNHKIEGFFDVCRAKGLNGEQGVLIPHQNVSNLMLREDVVEAVRQGQFHIYAVRTIDEGMEVLSGVSAGERGEDGSYPEGSINYLVSQRLKQMAESLKGFYFP